MNDPALREEIPQFYGKMVSPKVVPLSADRVQNQETPSQTPTHFAMTPNEKGGPAMQVIPGKTKPGAPTHFAMTPQGQEQAQATPNKTKPGDPSHFAMTPNMPIGSSGQTAMPKPIQPGAPGSPTQTATPKPLAQGATGLPTPAPTPAEATRPLTPPKPPSQESLVAPKQAPISTEGHAGDESLAIRTFESDTALAMQHKKTSAAEIALAESRRSTGEDAIATARVHSHAGRKVLASIVSVVLIFGGLGAMYYFYEKSALAPIKSTANNPAARPIIATDGQVVMPIDGLTPVQVASRVRSEVAKPHAPNTITEIIPTQAAGESTTRPGIASMIGLMEISAPDTLARSLSGPWMLGLYTDSNGDTSVFVIATSNFFQNTFAGMLSWEGVMADDLKQYLLSTSSDTVRGDRKSVV